MAVSPESTSSATVHVIDGDASVKAKLESIVAGLQATCEYYATVESFLGKMSPSTRGCVVSEVRVGVMSGIELAEHLTATNCPLPTVIYTRHATTSLTVRAMRSGAIAVIDKGSDDNLLWEAVARALGEYDNRRALQLRREHYERLFQRLTEAETAVLEAIVDGRQNKDIASKLDVSVRTVETRRRSIFHKLQIDNVAALVRLYCETQQVLAR